MKLQALFPFIVAGMTTFAQENSVEKVPFGDIDMTWANGNDRRTDPIFDDW